MSDKQAMTEALKKILLNKVALSQEHICQLLAASGFETNQSKVSRLLIQLNAFKVKNDLGQLIYTISREPAPLSMDNPLDQLVIDIASNGQMIVIHTSPGAASLVARLLDYSSDQSPILGTVAGDDTIFVAPKEVSEMEATLGEVRQLLRGSC